MSLILSKQIYSNYEYTINELHIYWVVNTY